jgi:putative membrane protein
MQTPRWRRDGREPDYRFSLANERTFLAWIRTALSLLAGGVLLEQFAPALHAHGVATVLALGLASLAAVLCGLAYVRWRSNEVAMRHDRPLPTTVAIPLVASALLVVAALVSVLARFP